MCAHRIVDPTERRQQGASIRTGGASLVHEHAKYRFHARKNPVALCVTPADCKPAVRVERAARPVAVHGIVLPPRRHGKVPGIEATRMLEDEAVFRHTTLPGAQPEGSECQNGLIYEGRDNPNNLAVPTPIIS
ncbi:hypothethical protein, Antivirulence factor domain [Ralstonia solanacearum PSI07]|nr:hypothethical protein, Antivirulence factor domain [Ralstonia solanacearum PSI07]